jgi:hypothetical protein
MKKLLIIALAIFGLQTGYSQTTLKNHRNGVLLKEQSKSVKKANLLTFKNFKVMETFRAEVLGVGENVWSSNSMEFKTEQEAKDWLIGLSRRWFGCDAGRIVKNSTERNQEVNWDTDTFTFNFRNR